MKVTLIAPTARSIPAAGDLIVQPDETVDLPRPLVEGLLKQTDVWAKPDTTTKSDPESEDV